jgi:trigger factor
MQPLIKPDPENPLVFEMIVPLNPLVELCDYHNIKLEQEPLNISNEGVAEVLEKFRIQKAEHETADRPVQEGDLITIDIEGILSGSSFMHKKGVKFQVSSGFPPDIPGFYQEMIGISKGEEKKFELKLPDDYTDKVVAGKEVSFKVKVNDIQNTILPELNDEFANKVAPGIKTLASLRKRIETNMKKEQERNAESQFKEMVVKCVIEKSKLEYPPIVVDAEAQNLISEYMKQLQLSCKSSEEYEEKRKHVSEAKLKEWGRDTAERRVLWSLVLNEVAKSENIDVDDWEIEEEIEHMISGADEEREKQREGLSSYQNRQNVYSLLKARKTVNRLAEIVKTANN